MNRGVRGLITALMLATFTACAPTDEPTSALAAGGARAEGVRLEVALPGGGQMVVRGEQLIFDDGGAGMTISGNAQVKVDREQPLEVRADVVRVRSDGSLLELDGDVRATIPVLGVTGGADGGC